MLHQDLHEKAKAKETVEIPAALLDEMLWHYQRMYKEIDVSGGHIDAKELIVLFQMIVDMLGAAK